MRSTLRHLATAVQKATSTHLFSSCSSDVGGVAVSGVSQDFFVLLCEVLLGRPGLFCCCCRRRRLHVEARAPGDVVSGGAEAGALRHGAAAEDFADHGQAARALGDDAAVSADLGAGLLQRGQKAHPVHSVMVHVACLLAPTELPCFDLSTDWVTWATQPTVAREGQK